MEGLSLQDRLQLGALVAAMRTEADALEARMRHELGTND
jgi:hypothetical protein